MSQPFSFPYPKLGTVIRPAGQGCNVCVHQMYCPALYWFRRYGLEEEPVDDRHMGVSCLSWSTDPNDKVTTHNQRDLDEVEYIYNQGIGSEANRNGFGPVTGSNRKP